MTNDVMGQAFDGEPEYFYDDDWPRCPACNGSGTVNELTAPHWFFCLGVTTCPVCDGTGEAP